ncbi:hypothetical protein BD413DRAFT_495003 [Trametes elegans]|nr:hypothetical protein BD413DRAFT_495003 [Trametes elegans]
MSIITRRDRDRDSRHEGAAYVRRGRGAFPGAREARRRRGRRVVGVECDADRAAFRRLSQALGHGHGAPVARNAAGALGCGAGNKGVGVMEFQYGVLWMTAQNREAQEGIQREPFKYSDKSYCRAMHIHNSETNKIAFQLRGTLWGGEATDDKSARSPIRRHSSLGVVLLGGGRRFFVDLPESARPAPGSDDIVLRKIHHHAAVLRLPRAGRLALADALTSAGGRPPWLWEAGWRRARRARRRVGPGLRRGGGEELSAMIAGVEDDVAALGSIGPGCPSRVVLVSLFRGGAKGEEDGDWAKDDILGERVFGQRGGRAVCGSDDGGQTKAEVGPRRENICFSARLFSEPNGKPPGAKRGRETGARRTRPPQSIGTAENRTPRSVLPSILEDKDVQIHGSPPMASLCFGPAWTACMTMRDELKRSPYNREWRPRSPSLRTYAPSLPLRTSNSIHRALGGGLRQTDGENKGLGPRTSQHRASAGARPGAPSSHIGTFDARRPSNTAVGSQRRDVGRSLDMPGIVKGMVQTAGRRQLGIEPDGGHRDGPSAVMVGSTYLSSIHTPSITMQDGPPAIVDTAGEDAMCASGPALA